MKYVKPQALEPERGIILYNGLHDTDGVEPVENSLWLTRLFPMHPFSTPDVFRGQRKGALGKNCISVTMDKPKVTS